MRFNTTASPNGGEISASLSLEAFTASSWDGTQERIDALRSRTTVPPGTNRDVDPYPVRAAPDGAGGTFAAPRQKEAIDDYLSAQSQRGGAKAAGALQGWEIDYHVQSREQVRANNVGLLKAGVDPASLSAVTLVVPPGASYKVYGACNARTMPTPATRIKCRAATPDYRKDQAQVLAVRVADTLLPPIGAALDGAPDWLTADVLLAGEVDGLPAYKIADHVSASDKTVSKHLALARGRWAACGQEVAAGTLDARRCEELRTLARNAIEGDLPWFHGATSKRATMAERIRQERLRLLKQDADAIRKIDTTQTVAARRMWLDRLADADGGLFTAAERATMGSAALAAAQLRLAREWEAAYRAARPKDTGRVRTGTRAPAKPDEYFKKLTSETPWRSDSCVVKGKAATAPKNTGFSPPIVCDGSVLDAFSSTTGRHLEHAGNPATGQAVFLADACRSIHATLN